MNNLIISEDKINYLVQLINYTFGLLDSETDNEFNQETDWAEELNKFNELCEEIYNLE